MVATATKQDGEAYVNLLPRIIQTIENLGYKPYFLIHEGRVDRNFTEEINQKLITRLPIVQEDNPLHIKGIISKSKAVITSRFHGLVSCLSQAIPCLATSWSHKYETLLQDYNYPEGMLDVYCDDELLIAKVKSVLTEPSRNLIIEKLKNESVKQKKRSEEMWEKVFKKIEE